MWRHYGVPDHEPEVRVEGVEQHRVAGVSGELVAAHRQDLT